MAESAGIELLSILESVKEQLNESDFESIHELIKAREWGVGFENLCTQLYEYDVNISLELYSKIISAGDSMGLPAETWEMLEELID